MSALMKLPAAVSVPLVVDLDGTLVSSDLLAESTLALIRKSPLQFLKLPLYLASGRAALKAKLAQLVQPEVDTLPYRRDVLDFLEAQKRSGRTLILATATNDALAHKVADHLGLFSQTLASDDFTNLAAETKAQRLVALFGKGGFDYVGNSWRDLPVWRKARKAILVQPSAWLRRRVAASTVIERVFEGKREGLAPCLQELRWYHWLKNVLVFVPLFAEHRLYELALLRHAVLAFVAFSLCASSVYLLNDLLDLPADRAHPLKKERPLAAGRLSIACGLVLAAALLGASIAIGTELAPGFLVAIGIYFALNLAYCLRLKDIAYLDALVLGAGYSLRIVAGASSVDMRVSPWLLVTSLLFFFGLALLKRYAELISLHLHYGHQAYVRAYAIQKDGAILEVGTVSGFLAVLVLALYGYLLEQEGLRFASVVALCAILLVWTLHLWRMARLGRISGDPVAFVYKDRVSQIAAAATLAILLLSA